MLATVLAATTLVGCGDKKDDKKEDKKNDTKVEESTGAPTVDESKVETPVVEVTEKLECPDTSSWTDADKIYFYSWNDEFGSRMQYVLDAYPELVDYVEYVNLGCSGTDGTYTQTIDNLIQTNAEKFPSIIAADNDVAKYYTETELTLKMSDIGITDAMYANAYDFSKQYATFNGDLKALTWQACPGCFVYRTDIADAVWGQSDSDFVQSKVANWDAFFAAADEVKAAGYKMVAGPDEIKYACFDQQTQPWISADYKLQLDSSVSDFFELSKKLYDGEYTNNASMWDSAWNDGYEGDVLGYFGCTWSVYWCMVFDESKGDDSSYGKWNLCAGPVGYHWGGTYAMVMDGCPNTELAAFLLYSLCCDEDIMYTLAVDTKDFVNNKAVIEKEIANGDGADPILGGVNPVEVWSESVKNINLSNATFLDADIKNYITDASTAYNSGELASVDEAMDYVKNKVAENFDYITVE